MIVMEDKLKAIKHVILDVASKHGVEVDRIILFGSRARGDYSEDSDWDILVVTKRKLGDELKWKLWDEIMRELRKIDVDVFITDVDSFRKYKSVPGTLERYSVLEGMIL